MDIIFTNKEVPILVYSFILIYNKTFSVFYHFYLTLLSVNFMIKNFNFWNNVCLMTIWKLNDISGVFKIVV